MPRPCQHCTSLEHTSFYCRYKPRTRIASKARIKRVGKQHKNWIETRDHWFEVNKAAYYWCHYCGKSLTRSQLTLDHKIPRSRAPGLRYILANLVPCCWICNGLKGSIAHDEYSHTCHLGGSDTVQF